MSTAITPLFEYIFLTGIELRQTHCVLWVASLRIVTKIETWLAKESHVSLMTFFCGRLDAYCLPRALFVAIPALPLLTRTASIAVAASYTTYQSTIWGGPGELAAVTYPRAAMESLLSLDKRTSVRGLTHTM